MEYIIDVSGLKKSFKVSVRNKAGFTSAVKALFKREYTIVDAVKDIDFKVEKGEIRGLIGPNGAGKSTTIKILSGVLYPTEGSVKVMDFIPWKQREEYVKKIGVVFGQKSQLWWDLPPLDTFLLNRKMYNIPQKTFEHNVDYFVELLGIQEVVKRPVRQLSLGERMKCELVCALLHEPELIYLDEPTIGLDVISKEIIRNFIKQVNKDKKTTFILTTHDLADIENLCENVTIINNGTIVFNDSLDRLRTFFSSKKIIDVKFNREVDRQELGEFSVLESDVRSASIEVDLSGTDIQSELQKVIGKLPIQDINVNDISIEAVIKQIYQA